MRRKGVRILAIFILICINISIFSRVNADTINVALESEEYAISQKSLTISRIIPKTDIEEFKQQFNLEKEKVHVYAKNGTTEMKNGVIGTGMKIRFDNIENEYTACVIGDINGDGEISQYEISKAIKHVVGLEAHQLSGINATAIDVDGDGEITQKDVSILIKYVVYGKLDIDGKKIPTAPIISVLSGEQGKNNWYTSSVELQINKPEKSPVKIEYMVLEITGTENIQETQIDDDKKITIQQDGTYEVKAYSVSVIGTKSEIATMTVKINKTSPINAEIVATLGSEDGTEYIFGETAKQNIYVKAREEIGNKVTIEAQGANEFKAGTSLPIVLENEGKTKLIVSTENEAGLVTKREYTAIIDKQIKRPGSLTLKLNDANGNEYKSNTWTNQNVYMEIAQGGQNIVTTFKVDGTVAIEERFEPLTITQEGLYTITVINRDDVGNESQSSLRVKIDKTAPTAPVLQIVKGEKDKEDNEWYKGDVNLRIIESTEDEGGSGVSHATYEVSGAVTVPESKTNGQEMAIVNEGIYTITIYEYDVAGNKSEGATQIVKIDKTVPQNIQLVASQITGKTFHIQASSGENLSGTAKYQLHIDGKLYKELNSSENTADFDIVEQSSKTHDVMVKITDVAGNTDSKTIQVNMVRLNINEIDHIEFQINSFIRTNNGSTVANGSDFLISDTSLSDASKFIQVNSETVQTKGTISGTIKLVRKDGEVVNALEYFPEGLKIEVSQYSNGSGTVWQHNANINMLNSVTSNQGKEEGQTYTGTVIVSDKQNKDNTFSVSDEKQKGTKTYTRLIIRSITLNDKNIPFRITSNVI